MEKIRKSRVNLPVSLDITYMTSRVGTLVRGHTTASVPMTSWKSFSHEYQLFRVSYTNIAAEGTSSIVYDVVSGQGLNKVVHEYQRTFNIGLPC